MMVVMLYVWMWINEYEYWYLCLSGFVYQWLTITVFTQIEIHNTQAVAVYNFIRIILPQTLPTTSYASDILTWLVILLSVSGPVWGLCLRLLHIIVSDYLPDQLNNLQGLNYCICSELGPPLDILESGLVSCNQDRACHAYDLGATRTCTLPISGTTPELVAPLSCS